MSVRHRQILWSVAITAVWVLYLAGLGIATAERAPREVLTLVGTGGGFLATAVLVSGWKWWPKPEQAPLRRRPAMFDGRPLGLPLPRPAEPFGATYRHRPTGRAEVVDPASATTQYVERVVEPVVASRPVAVAVDEPAEPLARPSDVDSIEFGALLERHRDRDQPGSA